MTAELTMGSNRHGSDHTILRVRQPQPAFLTVQPTRSDEVENRGAKTSAFEAMEPFCRFAPRQRRLSASQREIAPCINFIDGAAVRLWVSLSSKNTSQKGVKPPALTKLIKKSKQN